MQTQFDERVLVLMPTARDGERTSRLMAEADMACHPCENVPELCREIERGAGVALLTEEAIEGDREGRLRETLKAQPPWSDLPLVVLARQGGADAPIREEMNATLIERPLKVRSLLSVVRAALRSRRRQYDVRDHLEERRLATEAQAYLVRLSDALRPLSSSSEIQAAASRILGEHFGANRVAYFEIREGDYVVEQDYTDGVESHVGRHEVSSFGAPLLAAFLAGRTVIEDDAASERGRTAKELAAFAAIRVRGHVEVPLVKDGHFVAGMTVHYREPHDWREEEVWLIEQTAERTWAAVERARAEADLRDIQSRMEAALAAGAIGTWAWDVSDDRFHGAPSFARIFAVPPAAVAGGPVARIVASVHPDDRDRVSGLVDAAIEAGGRYEADYRVADGAGGWRWVSARGQVDKKENGKGVRLSGVVIEVTDRKEAEAALDRVKAESDRRTRLYEAVLSSTPDLAYVWGLDHRFTYANEGLLRMWGKTWDEAIGKNCLELGYEPWHAEMHDREIEEVRATRKPLRGEVPFTGTFGRRIYDYLLVPVLGAGGEVEAVAGTTRDVTERKEMEQELRDHDRKKDDFIALLAHELRNPLAPIRNGLNVLRLAGAESAVARETREMMERQLTHMVRLIDDLLDISRINRNKMELRLSRVPLAEALKDALEAARPFIDAEGHTLTVSVPDRPIYVEADLTRLAQVFGNLLTNSAKYTRRGGNIHLTVERRGEVASISVSDDGIGIPAASQAHIFDMFSQVDRSVERATGGLGIGLALVKGLVEMHGGKVAAQSDGEGMGSTFTITLPIAAEPAAPKARQPSGQAAIRRRVLVVDDSRDGAVSLARMLRLMGHDVRTANDGIEGVEAAREFRPEVILMDLGMPLLNGLDATRRIRGQDWGRDIVIIALTGWGQEGDKERSRDAGCDGHLVKPVDFDELRKLLEMMPTKDGRH
ncbi:ATP-binding protein [Aquisphaera insulae]|uniref:ATP-binding protein n=1 Tax=Aquisphaera insulae TaxID=2712864 RepID=UPI00196AD90A|nr:ATP-binding protein [Aquisphaera insulae]